MDTADRFLNEILATAEHHAGLVRAGVEGATRAAELRINPALRNLGACYRKAEKDAAALIPSYLQAAIENVLHLLPAPGPYEERRAEPRGHREEWEKDQSGRGDMSPRGGQLVPGS